MTRFDYFEPTTLEQAIAQLRQAAGQASMLAGGTDLLVQIREGVRRPQQVIDIKKIIGLEGLSFNAQRGLRIGALATTRELETSPLVREKYAGLAQAVTHFASIQVRQRATVVGNVCRASPSADTLPPLIADSASVTLRGAQGERSLPLQDFCIGPGRTQRAEDELVTHLQLPPPAPHTGKVYLKHGRRAEMELATVGVAVSLTRAGSLCHDLRIVLAAVAPTPLRAVRAEALLRGRAFNDAAAEAAARCAMHEAQPIGDVRGSAEYRRQMVAVLTRRALKQAWSEAA